MRPPDDRYAQAAALQFDRACRLMPRHSNQQIADALGEVLGVTISRRAVADWRRGFTEIKAAYLLAAFELAGIVQVLEIGALPAQRGSLEPGQVLAPAAGGQTRRWNGRPRLQVIGAGLSFLLLLLWALPHTPLRPYVDVVVTYASHIAQPGSGSGGSSSHPATARAPSREPDTTPQPAAPTATPPPATGQVDQTGSAPARGGPPATGTAATAAVDEPPANRGPATPAAPPASSAPRDAAPVAAASGNQGPVQGPVQDPAGGSAQGSSASQPPGLVPGVVNGVASTLNSTVGELTGS